MFHRTPISYPTLSSPQSPCLLHPLGPLTGFPTPLPASRRFPTGLRRRCPDRTWIETRNLPVTKSVHLWWSSGEGTKSRTSTDHPPEVPLPVRTTQGIVNCRRRTRREGPLPTHLVPWGPRSPGRESGRRRLGSGHPRPRPGRVEEGTDPKG